MRVISGMAKGTKLFTLEGLSTRPTLDRIKEPLFSIIQNRIQNSIILDLFAGSGALGIESLSRGANFCYFCDNSTKATNIIDKNLSKTRFKEKSELFTMDYKSCLKQMANKKLQFNLIFLDPPYESDLIYLSVKQIKELKLLAQDGIIIAETDNEKELISKLEQLNAEVFDIRKYGRVRLLFLN